MDDGSKAVAVGTTIAIIGEEGDDLSGADALAKESESAPAPKAEEKETKEEKPAEKKEASASSSTSALESPSTEKKYGSGGGSEPPKAAPTGDKPKFFASPLARKIALEQGIPLGQIKGTGPEGRIVKADVENYKPSAAGSSSAAAKTPTSGATSLPGSAAAGSPAEYEDIPLTNMRRTIGKRLTESKQQLPHYYLTVEINMG